MDKRYLVTGGAGFIGCNIARRLLMEGYQVRVLDNFCTGSYENLKDLDVELIKGDLTNYRVVQRAVKGVDYILHQGALPSVLRSVNEPIASLNVNVLGILNVLTAAVAAGVKRVVYASSSSVYGDSSELPNTETMLPMPRSPYAASKLSGEHLCQAFYETYGLETIMLRYFSIFGPYQNPCSQYAAAIPNFITAALTNQTAIVIFGDGKQTRDFTFVDNVIEANLLAIKASREALGKAFNIACGKSYSLLDLLSFLEHILGKKLKREHTEPRTGDVRHSLGDVTAARHFLHYEPKVGFQEGLEKTVAWFKHL